MAEADPRGGLKRLAERTEAEFPNLWAARARTEEALSRVSRQASALPHDEAASIVLFGSWARMELTPHSDDDWLILVNGPRRRRGETRPTDEEVARVVESEDGKPGRQKVFGITAYCNEFVNKIGLNHDTNANLTRRVLLMLESVPVSGEAAYRDCWERVFDCYLREAHSGRLPRFFLNDVIRYWRTICVDFVGKQRESEEKWGTRNAKLRTSRKFLFAGGLLPILQCHGLDLADSRTFLAAQLTAPTTDRIAQAFLTWGAADAGRRCLEAYDRWIGMLNRQEVRRGLRELSSATADRSEVFQQVREIAKEVDRCLLMLLFETDLEPVSRQFGVF
jgi:predicted nucleotidyltransferase